MKITYIKEKLQNMGVHLEDIIMGDFDYIGEFTAKKNRHPTSENYKKHGCFFRPNYERGILLYYLIRKYNIESVLEIGFGRGYSSFCMAKAMSDHGIEGKITTVDPNLNEEFLNGLTKVFRKEWFEKINFVKGYSQEFFNDNKEKYDLIFIDGDHRYEAVKTDWESSKDLFNKFILFDDYHLPSKVQKDIEVARVVDDIVNDTKELIIGDRRIFHDDREIPDEKIDYGQMLIQKN